MNEILNQDIGLLVKKYPEISAVLEAYGVPCGPKSAHTCRRLRDIVVLQRMCPRTPSAGS